MIILLKLKIRKEKRLLNNLIFDVGNVLLDYRWKDMLMDHGLSEDHAQKIGLKIFDHPYWNKFDMGILSEKEVIDSYAQMYPEDAEIIEWFITHGEYMYVNRPDVWQKVHECKKLGYKIYLLSNYSEELFRKHTKEATFLADADGGVISYQVHMAKPDKRIYKHLLGKYELIAEKCIFYDDREENTKAARTLGMKAETITSKELLLDLLDKRLEDYGRSDWK